MGNEYQIKLNTYKINHLFKNIRKLNGGKNLLAKKLGITPATLDDYLKQGDDYLAKFDDKLQPIYDLDIDGIDEEIVNHKGEFVEEFLVQEGSQMLCDKNRNAFEVYFIEKKENIKEQTIFKYQKDIIDTLKWSDNDLENHKIKLLMLFRLIYDRAQMSLDEELLYLKNRYSKTSSKHVAIVVKDLERRNKEDFGEVKENPDNQKNITFNQINNFTHFSLEMEKQLGILKKNETPLIEDNEEDVIDITPLQNDD